MAIVLYQNADKTVPTIAARNAIIQKKGADGKDFLYTVAAPLLMYVIYYLN